MSYKVLVVDDSKLARMAVAKALGALQPDWTRVEAANADEALAALAEDKPDFAVLDFNMPGRDGLELAEQFRKVKPTMPVAVISANHQQEIVDRAHAVGRHFPAQAANRTCSEGISDDRREAPEGFPGMTGRSASDLNVLELDALTELVNLGVSRAALSLREMIGQQVVLSVPSVKMIARARAIEILGKNEPNKLVAVHQVFEGDINGRALLIFPETRSLELVRAVTKGDLPLEDILELEQEALAETGNIILNGCLATIANLLQRTLKISLPEILRGASKELFNLPPPPPAGDTVLFVYINFSVRERDIKGYISMLMDLPSLAALKVLLGAYIERVAGGVTQSPDA
jgi:chemotaxis protein CheC